MKFLSDILARAGLVVDGTVTLNSVANATTDTDRFIVVDSGVVKYRTGTQLLSDIGGISGNQTITLSGDATGSGTTSIAVTLANSGVTAGTYGSSTAVPVITVDAKGRVTGVTTASISGSLTFTGDVTGSGTTGSTTTLTLANSGVAAGTYNNVTVNAKGLVTSGSNVSYLTSYTETDTLGTVTGRGATTSTQVILNGGIRMGNAYLNPSGDLNHFHFNGTAIIPNTTTTASNASMGTSAYRWSVVYGGGLDLSGSATISGSLTASSIIRSGGTSSQFLKADGSVDSSTYATSTGGNASGTWGINVTGSAGSATQVVTLQDNPPTGLDGKLWWETDTGRLKVYYAATSAWVDALPMPDMTLYYPKAGGSITGDVSILQNLSVTGNTLLTGTVTASSLIKSGGTSSQFLKADGSVDSSTYATTSYVTTQINNLVNGAPGLLDTLDELAAALGDDPNFATTITTALSNRLRIDINNQGLTSTQQGNGRTNLGLGSLATLSSVGNAQITDVAWSKVTGAPSFITGNQTITLSGDATGSGTTSIGVTLANSGVVAGTYTKVTVDAKGRVTSGTTLSAGDIPTLNYVAKSGDSMTGNLSFGSSGAGVTWAANTDGASITFESTGDGASGGRALSNLLIALSDNGDEGLKVTSAGTELFYVNTNQIQYKGNTVWHSANDGAGSGLDADLLDGISSASFLRSDVVGATVTGTILSNNNANVDGPNFNVDTTNKTVNEYAYKVSRSGSTVGGILIDGRGAFASGTTVNGSTVWHQGNLTNLNQLTNGPGYITGNQTITLTGHVTGSGTTSIATTIANGVVTNAMLANSSFNIGTTSISLGRASAAQTLTGVSIDGTAAYLRNTYTSADANSLWEAGVYTFFNGTNVPGGDFGMISIPTWGSTNSTNKYNLQIGSNISGNPVFRTTNINGAGTWYTFWHSGNLTNLNQLINGPGYITSYTETDTLQSVVSRGRTAAVGNTSYTGDGIYDAAATPVTFSTPHSSTTRIGYHDGGGGQYAATIGFLNTGYYSGLAAIRSRVSGEANDRFTIYHSGQIAWGAGGASGLDTNLYRDSADVLRTDDSFVSSVGLTVLRNLGTDNYATVGQHNMHLRLRKSSLDGGCAPRTLELGVLDNGTGIIQANHCGVGYNTLALNPVSGTVTINGSTAWHQGNLTNLNQLTNGPGYITSYTETDTLATVTGRGATTTAAISVNSVTGSITSSGSGDSNAPFRFGADYSGWMTIVAGTPGSNNGWGLFWAGNSGAQYGTNGTGGPGDIWTNSGNPNEYVFVGNGQTNMAIHGNTGNVWIAGTLRVAGTITGTLSGNASTASALTSMNISQFTNNSGYITSSGSISGSAGSATQVVTLQDNPPSGVNGQLWFETDTLRLKVYSSAASAWIDSFPMPDMSLYYTKAGGAITGSVVIQQDLTVNGQISADGILKMNTTGTSYIRMGRFPAGTTNSGEAWIGRASDRSVGTMTLQLGGSSNSSFFEIVDHAWSTVTFKAGMNDFSYKGNAIWHAGNLTNLNQLTNGPGYITGYTETDTLASVTGRGATTSSAVTFNAGITVNGTAYYTFSKPSTSSYQTVALFGSDSGGIFLTTDSGIISRGTYYASGWIARSANGALIDFADTEGGINIQGFTGATVGGAPTFENLLKATKSTFTWKGNNIWHAGNLTNLNQLSNGPGYITSSGSITGSAGSVAWTNVTGRPTALSSFNNDIVARPTLNASGDFQFGGQDLAQNNFSLSSATTDTDQFGRYYYSGTSGSIWTRYLPVDKSGKYRMKIRWKASAGSTTYVAVILLDTSGNNINGAGTYWAYPFSGGAAPTSWTTNEYWYDGSSFPANAAYVAFGISHTNYGGGSATYYVSQLEIERYHDQIAGNAIINAGGTYSNPSWITSLAWSKITGAPAFITSYTETDTLATVTGRGASTSTALSLNGGVTITGPNAWNAATPMLNIGGTGDGRMQVRHIWGKEAGTAAADHLWLQYTNSTFGVQIGASGGSNPLYVAGDIYMGGYFGGNLVATRTWVTSQGYITSSGSISGNAATATNASQLGGWSLQNVVPYHSGSDFADGTLVVTNINAAVTYGDSFVMEVTGKTYGSGAGPFGLLLEGYIYADTFINVGAISYGGYFPGPIKILNYNGNLAFWWPRGSYWNSFGVSVRDAGGSSSNRVTSIGNSTEPASSKKVSITPVQSLHSSNYNSYAPTLTGGGASGTWGINITGSAGSASSASTATSATQVVTIQDTPPSGSNGRLWWESDTGRLKVYYSAASAWVDATAIPDMSLYYPKAGGSITGNVTVQQTLNVIGNTLFQANSIIQGNLTIQGQLAGVTMSGPIRRNAHANGFLEGSYNNIGGNSSYTNPIYTIGSNYNPSDTSLNSMYGIGYAHPNFWGSGKTSSWGLYVANGGVINVTLGEGSTSIWAQNDIVAYSDARVKDNIEVVENAVEKIQAIRGVTFTRTDASEKDRNKRHAGVIAQEVLKVLPEVVSGTEEDMYSVAYGNMAALFIEAIKEQQVQISELKNLVDKLTDKLNN